MIRGILALTRPRKTSPDRRSELDPANGYAGRAADGSFTLESEEMFRKVLALERKRSERSRQRFVLMLLHTGQLLQGEGRKVVLDSIIKALSVSTRETDLHGWYKEDMVVGVICTEIGSGSMTSILSTLHSRICTTLRNNLNLEQMNVIQVSFHVFPDDLDLENGGRPADKSLYPDLFPQDTAAKASQSIKRSIDIIGSLCALVLLSPLLIVITVVI